MIIAGWKWGYVILQALARGRRTKEKCCDAKEGGLELWSAEYSLLCKLARGTYMIGPRPKPDGEPQRKVMDKGGVGPYAKPRSIRAHGGGYRSRSLSTLQQQQSRPQFTFYICVCAWKWVAEGEGRQIRKKQTEQPRQRNRQACEMCGKGQGECLRQL